MSNIYPSYFRKTKLDQSGMASILVTLIMSVVITLVVIGFAEVSTREQNNALQNQLSTTAFYAAETGVNDAIGVIQNSSGDPTLIAKNYCGAPTSTSSPYSNLYTSQKTFSLNKSQSNATYSCLLVNPAPTKLVTTVSSASQVIPLNASTAITSVNLSWISTTQTWNSGSCTNKGLTPSGSWTCGLSALRLDLVSVPVGTQITEPGLATSTHSAVLLPFGITGCNTSSSGIDIGSSSYSKCGHLFGSSCTTASGCNFTIQLPSGSTSTNYYLRVNTVYAGAGVLTISATGSSGSLPLNGAEYVIDSTGTANGVAKRIQVAVPIPSGASAKIPGFAIQATTDVCKRFYFIPNSGSVPNSTGETLGVPHGAVSDFLSPLPSNDCQYGY